MAVGEPILKRLAGPVAMSAADSTIATVGTGKRWLVKQVIMVNNNTGARTVQLAVGTTATAANRWFNESIAASGATVFNLALVLEAAETIHGNQGSSTDVTITINGIEQSVS